MKKRGYDMKDYFEEIVGYEDIKNELRIISDMLNNPETYRKLGAELKEGVILSGKPGTGKTTMANCLIRSIGRETYVCRKNSSDGDFIKTINNAFQSAKMNTPSIVLLDDLDKFSEKEEECDAEELAAVQSCIDEVKGSDVFIIATVNSIRKIPDSLLRPGRLGKRIHVRLPRCKEATEIVRHYMSKLETCDDLDEESVARMLDGESCATLESVINNAAMKAAYNRQSCINMQNVIDACLDIIFEVPKGGEELSEEAKLRVAYHEAGHALASEVLNPGSVSIISIRKADGKYGFVRYLRKEEYEDIYSDYNESIIKTSLAGKAATELVFGEADMGANADLHNAFNKAVELVDNMCMYGFDNWIQDKYSSSFSAENRNRAMAMVLEKNYLEVKKLLVENRELLDKIADALIRNTTLTFSDVQYICKTKCTSLNLKRAGKQR